MKPRRTPQQVHRACPQTLQAPARRRLTGPLLLALAGVAALQPAAAQTAPASSAVTVFGTLDLNITHTRAGGESNTAIDQGGNLLPSRLGFRGTEDLGDGLSAGFWLESAVLPDTGGVEGGFWHRRATLSLASASLGELRLGRDYTPTFWNVSQFAPFGTVGVAGSSNIIGGWPFGLGGARTLVRANNAVSYFLPRGVAGGFYGQAMVAAPEGTDGARYTGARLGYAAGPADVALAYGQTPAAGQTTRNLTLGGAYDFGAFKLMGYYFRQRASGERQVDLLLGATVKLGLGTLRASIASTDHSGGAGSNGDRDDARQFAIGYVHPLSKRTALYTTWSHIANQGSAAYVTSDSSPAAAPGGNASGLQLGVSHNF